MKYTTMVNTSLLELDLQIEQMIEKNEGLWQCKMCGKSSSQKQDIQRHSEMHIDGFTHSCHICNKTLSTRHSLRLHIGTLHSELSCKVCGKSGMNKVNLFHHKKSCKT